ncbi:YrdB family protein [Catenulispora subtropica]|uniref:Integral membrane protein n=1 Tax=Catenulispora subtropica TaxID=450798 RepID=A0ABP5BRF3_9ACTN
MLPKPLHVVNEGLAFVLELAALVLLAVWGFRTGSGTAVHVLLGLGAPALMVVVWGAFAAPRARFQLPMAGVLVVKAVVFGAATAAGYAAGWHAFAITFGVVAAVNTVIAAFDRESLKNVTSQAAASKSAP